MKQSETLEKSYRTRLDELMNPAQSVVEKETVDTIEKAVKLAQVVPSVPLPRR
ncbi:MAG: hypothetical protein ACOYNL_03135 [Rickettsiales bacterium]